MFAAGLNGGCVPPPAVSYGPPEEDESPHLSRLSVFVTCHVASCRGVLGHLLRHWLLQSGYRTGQLQTAVAIGMHLYLHTAVRSPQLCQHVCIIRAALLRPPVLWFGVRFCRLLCLPLHHSTSNFAMKSFPNRFHTVLFCATPCHGGAQGHHRATPQNGGGPASVGDTRPITLSSTVLISGSRSSCSFAGGAHTGRPTRGKQAWEARAWLGLLEAREVRDWGIR